MKHYIENSNINYQDSIFISHKNQQITFGEFYHNVCSKSRSLSRLNLSRTSHLDLITTGQESFLIITSKNAQSTVVPLSRSDSESEVVSEELPYA